MISQDRLINRILTILILKHLKNLNQSVSKILLLCVNCQTRNCNQQNYAKQNERADNLITGEFHPFLFFICTPIRWITIRPRNTALWIVAH